MSMLSLAFANEFENKIVIKKYQDDDFTLIDLKQEALIELKLSDMKELKYSSLDSNTTQDPSLQTLDTHKDFALLFAYGNNFTFKPFYESAYDFSDSIFNDLFVDLKAFSKMVFINEQSNDTYQDFSLFCALGACDELQLFNSSMFLEREDDEKKVYERIPDFILFVVLQDFKMRNNIINTKVGYKIVDIKNQKVIISRNFELSFETNPTKEPQRSKLIITQSLASNIKERLNALID